MFVYPREERKRKGGKEGGGGRGEGECVLKSY